MGVYTFTYSAIVESAIVAGANEPDPIVRRADPAVAVAMANNFADSGDIFPLGMGRFFVRNIFASLADSCAWFSAWLAALASAVPDNTHAATGKENGADTK